MLIHDLVAIGNKMLFYRKRMGLTQADVAEAAGLSDRTYADIERGSTNMRLETFLKICQALRVTPNEILLHEENNTALKQEELLQRFDTCSSKDKQTAVQLLSVYLKSLD